jgi:hypothetical protein
MRRCASRLALSRSLGWRVQRLRKEILDGQRSAVRVWASVHPVRLRRRTKLTAPVVVKNSFFEGPESQAARLA